MTSNGSVERGYPRVAPEADRQASASLTIKCDCSRFFVHVLYQAEEIPFYCSLAESFYHE